MVTFETWKGSETRERHRCCFCGETSDLGYHYACHICGATYCYIHMNKHARAHRPKVLPYALSATQ